MVTDIDDVLFPQTMVIAPVRLRKLMVRVDDRSRFYAIPLLRLLSPQLMLPVDDLCRFYA